jgi:hypothetical protein
MPVHALKHWSIEHQLSHDAILGSWQQGEDHQEQPATLVEHLFFLSIQ